MAMMVVAPRTSAPSMVARPTLPAPITTTLDPAKVAEDASKIQQIVRDDLPAVILFPRNDIFAYNGARFVSDPRIGATDFGFWFDVHNWELK